MTTLLARTCASIPTLDLNLAAATQQVLDTKTKPRRSLGRLEELACRIAAIRGEARPGPLQKAIVVMGADHGVVVEGISAYPQEVTRQMMLTFAAGGAAINVLARQAGAEVVVVDMGITRPLPDAVTGVRRMRIGAGTRNFCEAPAMSRDDALAAVHAGIALAHELADRGITLIGLGDMGIGNSTAASALTSVFTGASPAEVTGHGTGINDATHARKIAIIAAALARQAPLPNDALDALAKVGGFEIAGLTGVTLGAASRRVAVLADGFITGVAALAAIRMAPQCAGYIVPSHRSVEAGHRLVLQAIGMRPLLDLEMRLGEGTGAALAMPIVDAALAVLADMATFESAGVSDAGV